MDKAMIKKEIVKLLILWTACALLGFWFGYTIAFVASVWAR